MKRRHFVKGAALGLGAAAVMGSPLAAAQAPVDAKTYPFEGPPPPIPPSEIGATQTSDVVVVGAGIAGLAAALSAAEAGASVTLIEKLATFSARGGDVTALNTKLHEKLGIKVDPERIIHGLMKVQGGRIHHNVVRLWAGNSARVMNWALDMVGAEGLQAYLVMPTEPTLIIDRWPDPTGAPASWKHGQEYTDEFPTCHRLGDSEANQRKWLSVVEKKAKAKGVKILYKTAAVRLVRDEKSGRVTAVIAKSEADGKHVRFAARKGVVLATGDYSGNREMVDKYFPGCNLKLGMIPSSKGEGHLMAMWIGARMEKTPHAPLNDMSHALGTNPFLLVNKRGERFCNEDLDTEALARQTEEQNGCWLVLDASWPEDLPRMGVGFLRMFKDSPEVRERFNNRLKKGNILEAPTLEALAVKMKVPKDRFLKTVKRYNELAKKGVDLDFGKRGDRVTAIDKAPYYAQWTANPDEPMCIFAGLVCNERLQPVDAAGEPIPGLFLAGNTVGGRFKQAYPLLCPGISHGMALTHGYLAGRFALGLS
ncbi:MAG TPA: FAD-dependent oxidoreductase [Candidatus Aminicenantes bacterium]|nr:FAD-dependent oxidoreductase [Candidatus Aminicenantes bacterium]